MDYALTNYLALNNSSLDVRETKLNINDLILEDFIKNLDAKQETKETYLKGVRVFLNWCIDNNVNEVERITLIQYKQDLIYTVFT